MQHTEGTQAIRRAAAMLREVARQASPGTSLSELARSQGLARSTAHRILRCLLDEGLIALDDSGKRYSVGPLLHELGMVPGSSAEEIGRWRPRVEAVARRCGVTSYLMRRSGLDAVCLLKIDGHAPVRFVPVEAGQRRVLGVGAGATALLAALPAEQMDDTMRRIEPHLSAYPRITPTSLRAAVEQVRATGVAVSDGAVVKHGFGIGAVIADEPRGHLAISIAAYGTDVTESTIAAWKEVIREEAGQTP